jgi:hypothetical protein
MSLPAALIAVAALWGGPLAGDSLAGTQYWSTGSIGPSTTYVGHCRYYDAWNDIGLTTPAPEVYARNNYAGWGNDWQWVRFKVFIINRNNGDVYTPDGWSEWQKAWDNTPADFDWASAGAMHMSAKYPHSYRAEVRIEWWNQTSMLGASAHRITSYRYSFGGGWSSGYDACGYMGGFGS